MLFNSFSFLLFFAVVATATYLVGQRGRWPLLVGASLVFYAGLNLGYVGLLAGATLVAYVCGLAIQSAHRRATRRIAFIAGVVAELGALFVFKYFNFFAESAASIAQAGPPPLLDLVVPAGLSFFSFACVSYLADVYRGDLAAERHPGHFALYVAFFPKLLAGPIDRATRFLPQLNRARHFDPDRFTQGLQLMLWGLFKKVVIADRLAGFVNPAYQNPAFTSPAELLIATYLFAFQIYCDFSGYADIAIGAARILGFDLMENFRRPYLSTSVSEFWSQRWHISLARWFRDYLYIPLGGSRVSPPRWYLNLLVVFLVSGLWHGANWTFVIWGGLNGLYQVLDTATASVRSRIGALLPVPSPVSGVLSGLLTFHLILLTWVFFRAASLDDAMTVLTRIAQALPRLPVLLASYPYSAELLTSFVLVGLLLAWELIDERYPVWESLRVKPVYVRWATYYALLIGLVVLGRWGLSQFIYMQF